MWFKGVRVYIPNFKKKIHGDGGWEISEAAPATASQLLNPSRPPIANAPPARLSLTWTSFFLFHLSCSPSAPLLVVALPALHSSAAHAPRRRRRHSQWALLLRGNRLNPWRLLCELRVARLPLCLPPVASPLVLRRLPLAAPPPRLPRLLPPLRLPTPSWFAWASRPCPSPLSASAPGPGATASSGTPPGTVIHCLLLFFLT